MSLPNEIIPVGLLGTGAADTGYLIERSLRFNSADSAYLSRTPASAGNRKTWTWAGWVKRSGLSENQYLFDATTTGSNEHYIRFHTTEALQVGGDTSTYYQVSTSAVFRDLSAWYHIVVAMDTTQATDSDRIKIYVNGVQITEFSTATWPVLDNIGGINSTNEHSIGRYIAGNSRFFSGYLADIHFIDGQALDPTSFGEFDGNGIWQPIAYSGSYGTNGFHLPFSNNSTAAALGTDTSGNSNTWTVNNISVTAGAGNDSVVDVPTNGTETDTGVGGEVRGNYATLNPEVGVTGTTNVTLSNGNLNYTNSDGSTRRYIPSTITMPSGSGKYYCEGVYTTSTQTTFDCFGIIDAVLAGEGKSGGSNVAGIWAYRRNGNADIEATGGTSGISYGSSWATNDVIGIAYNSDTGSLTFYKNGVSQGVLVTGITNTVCFFVAGFSNCVAHMNFGQRPFAYTAPSGFKALNTSSLPAPLVTKPSEYMDVALYTGNSSTQTISGLEFSPDFVWVKIRSLTGSHQLADAIRGSTKILVSNTTAAETTKSTGITSFTSDGFTLGNDTGFNRSPDTYVAWTWDAGSSTVTNTDGSITSSVRTNNYLSIVTYTGTGSAATVGHGLGVTPLAYIIKRRDSADNWYYFTSVIDGSLDYLFLDTTAAKADSVSAIPTSLIFNVSTSTSLNASGGTYVAYCFAPVEGYSAFGSYTGTGNADGPFVYTGFRPRWVMYKRSDGTGNWAIRDTQRPTYNTSTSMLVAETTEAENTNNVLAFDFLSNGFKLRGTSVSGNASGGTYIYCAFAESPFQYARAR